MVACMMDIEPFSVTAVDGDNSQDSVMNNQETDASSCVHKDRVVKDSLIKNVAVPSTCFDEHDRSERSFGTATTECSVSSGASFACVPFKNNLSRGILRKESTISEEPREKPPQMRKRIVRFGTVLVRDYGMILGDHPCCSYGPPITIGWEYYEYEPLDVDSYEGEHALSRRSLREMMLNYYQRKYLLQDCTELDFKAVKREMKRVKLNRHITMQLARYHTIDAAFESACRKFKRMTTK